jgi:hypothetical protein
LSKAYKETEPMTYFQFTNHDPGHWRNLAQEKRDMANRMKTVMARASLANAAEYYDELARRAEADWPR